ncbi:hypothetical protein [Leptospira yasudae]|uniref:Outer membrane protein beta-barrel domain-containing protein n=1 Tax=Leptospira yasudae TaxID=2202201 RepID=A0ABX9M0L2_9LEPT|nr:hypothetical protein [Leptospira yasudae]RHX78127.1 hypothetical protein DLM77_18415 [Leptospira yasudae]
MQIKNSIARITALFPGLCCLYLSLLAGNIEADTILLKDGRALENVKTSLREDHVLVEDETGKTEKFDLKAVEKILVAEVKKSEPPQSKEELKDIKKFYFSIGFSEWNAKVTDKPGVSRGYNLFDFFTTVINIDPYFEKKYTIDVRTISVSGEYRKTKNLGFSLGLEQSSFSFPDRSLPPFLGILSSANLNSLPEYQDLAGLANIGFWIDPHFGDFKRDRQAGSPFRIETLSLLPSVKYYVPVSDSLFWFVQTGFGIGKSYQSGIYSGSVLQTVLFAGTGLQWESDSYFLNANVQYRQTELNASARSYRFSEPAFAVNVGFKL